MCMWCQIPITQLSSVSQVLWYVIYLCMSSPVVTVSFVAMCMWCHVTKFIMNFPNFLMIAYGAIIAAFSRLLQQTFWTFDVYVPGLLPQTYERISAEQHPSCDTRVLFPIHSLRDENLRFWPPAGADCQQKSAWEFAVKRPQFHTPNSNWDDMFLDQKIIHLKKINKHNLYTCIVCVKLIFKTMQQIFSEGFPPHVCVYRKQKLKVELI